MRPRLCIGGGARRAPLLHLIQITKAGNILLCSSELLSRPSGTTTATLRASASRMWMKQRRTTGLQECLYKLHSPKLDGEQEVLMQGLDAVEQQQQDLMVAALDRCGDAH
mmetsp:Transcript_73923/g.136425  ORF Transcript_73923/g.136425 Transcript_73923/m.136425 type:complete len:110 (+) Transcript_73923:1488-1817(+)